MQSGIHDKVAATSVNTSIFVKVPRWLRSESHSLCKAPLLFRALHHASYQRAGLSPSSWGAAEFSLAIGIPHRPSLWACHHFCQQNNVVFKMLPTARVSLLQHHRLRHLLPTLSLMLIGRLD